MKKSIGVFDSGFGGLLILKEMVRTLPRYDFVYLGDTARTPYGTRSRDVVYRFTEESVEFLFAKHCELIVLACNTASSEALRKIQRNFLSERFPARRVLGVLIPTAEEAAEKSKSGRIGVLATEGTVKSKSFVRELKKARKDVQVFQSAAPLLVPFIESGEENSKALDIVLQKYLFPLKRARVDTVILGCTHYGILEKKVQNIMGKNVRIISEGKIVARKLKEYLARHPEIEAKLGKGGKRTFYTSDLTEKFSARGKKFFGHAVRARAVDF